MDKIRLKQVIDSTNMNYNDLYYNINVIDKVKTAFDANYYNEIVYLCLFLYHIEHGIDKLSKNGNIPKLFSKIN